MEEFHFDGFRFDGVTSMLYYSHGLGEAFCNYGDYFNGNQDDSAICYLTLANRLIHEVNPRAITIAEEVSGMPGLAASFTDGGYGFDYRMAMNIPDYWIKIIKERRDEDWKPSSLFWEVTNRRKDEKRFPTVRVMIRLWLEIKPLFSVLLMPICIGILRKEMKTEQCSEVWLFIR